MHITQPACRACGAPATLEVRGHWGDLWDLACDEHQPAVLRRALDILAVGHITVRDLDPVIIRKKKE